MNQLAYVLRQTPSASDDTPSLTLVIKFNSLTQSAFAATRDDILHSDSMDEYLAKTASDRHLGRFSCYLFTDRATRDLNAQGHSNDKLRPLFKMLKDEHATKRRAQTWNIMRAIPLIAQNCNRKTFGNNGNETLSQEEITGRIRIRAIKWREANGVFAMSSMRKQMKTVDNAMVIAKHMDASQWFCGVIGTVDLASGSMRPPLDRTVEDPEMIRSLESRPAPRFSLPCPEDVDVTYRQELLQKYNKSLPSFADWVEANKTALQTHFPELVREHCGGSECEAPRADVHRINHGLVVIPDDDDDQPAVENAAELPQASNEVAASAECHKELKRKLVINEEADSKSEQSTVRTKRMNLGPQLGFEPNQTTSNTEFEDVDPELRETAEDSNLNQASEQRSIASRTHRTQSPRHMPTPTPTLGSTRTFTPGPSQFPMMPQYVPIFGQPSQRPTQPEYPVHLSDRGRSSKARSVLRTVYKSMDDIIGESGVPAEGREVETFMDGFRVKITIMGIDRTRN